MDTLDELEDDIVELLKIHPTPDVLGALADGFTEAANLAHENEEDERVEEIELVVESLEGLREGMDSDC